MFRNSKMSRELVKIFESNRVGREDIQTWVVCFVLNIFFFFHPAPPS
jgi:hypothetical protein